MDFRMILSRNMQQSDLNLRMGSVTSLGGAALGVSYGWPDAYGQVPGVSPQGYTPSGQGAAVHYVGGDPQQSIVIGTGGYCTPP